MQVQMHVQMQVQVQVKVHVQLCKCKCRERWRSRERGRAAEKDGCSRGSRGSRVLVAAAAALLGEFFWTTLEQHWCSEPLSGVMQKNGRRPQRAVEPVLRLA